MRAFAQLANQQTVSTSFSLAKIFSRFLYLHTAVRSRHFFAYEHEHSVVGLLEIERTVFRQCSFLSVATVHGDLDYSSRAVEPRLPDRGRAARLFFPGIAYRAC